MGCKYHLVFIPKKRRKVFFGSIRKEIGEIFHELANQKGCNIIEGHQMADHVHMCIEIPPKHAVSSIVGFIKGKSAIMIARRFLQKERNFVGEHFWARGYAVSTVGFELEVVKKYIREQEANDESVLARNDSTFEVLYLLTGQPPWVSRSSSHRLVRWSLTI
jgi:putative transposase